MSGGMSNFGAYWLGALVGLIFAVALAATLSVVSPLPGEKPMEIAAAPAQEPEPAAPAQTTEAPASEAPAPEAEVVAEPEAEAEPAPAAEPTTPEPATPEVATPEPSTPAPSEPVVTTEAETGTETETETVAEATPAPAPVPTPEAAPGPEAEAEAEATEDAAAQVPAPTAINALRDNSERYRGDESQPLLSIVLVGLGDPALNLDEIFLLPAPLTVVVDARADDAGSLVADARDSGFEAMVAVDQTAIENIDALLEGAGPIIGVAMLDGDVASAAGLSALSEGLTARSMGLFDASVLGGGSAYRAAQAISLPAAPGGRRFDDNQNSEAVYQALERAAFDARRAGAFVVYARPDPAIMTGLRRWMSLKANRSVAVAPLSTVMRKLARN